MARFKRNGIPRAGEPLEALATAQTVSRIEADAARVAGLGVAEVPLSKGSRLGDGGWAVTESRALTS